MSEFISTANGLIALLTGLFGLIGAGIAAFFAIKGFVKAFREKSLSQQWALIMEIADAAMKEAEASGKDGKSKKEQVLAAVDAGCKAAGIDASAFWAQLGEYIDQTIAFVNGMAK